ncbi:MAG: hypothetical protein LUG57_01940 [Oscillospiraceae bacterium]|nr:hypothetical protein [Oscillospiraceae bacterium]
MELSPATDSSPATGDSGSLTLWLTLFAAASVGLTLALIHGKKKAR